jgi:cellulose synthase/poly-beta-1,6-N-acetylglucosamine synthase-like glycosyltransferase
MNIDPALILLILGLLGSYFLVMSLMQVLLQTLSYLRFQRNHQILKPICPALTLIIPARNEAEVVVEAINRALQIPLAEFEVLVVENASTDKTFHLLQEMFQLRVNGDPQIFRSVLFPKLKVLRSAEAGKTLALNLALAHVKSEIVATLDADTLPELNGLLALLNEFAIRPELQSIGGIIRVMDKNSQSAMPPRFLPALQSLEYLRAFSGERLGWGLLNANIYTSGACAFYRTQGLKERGGFQGESVTEDLETSLELVKHFSQKNHPIEILPIVVAHTQVPHGIGSLIRQRRRWQAGLWQCLWKYRSLFFQGRGLVGTLTLPNVVLTEALGPFFEILALATLAHALFYELITLEPVLFISLFGLLLSATLTSWTAMVENRHLKKAKKWSIVKVFILSFLLNLLLRPIINIVRLEASLRFPWIKNWGSIKRGML